MNGEKLKNRIGANITSYRKQAGLTQAGLAERLNYSDKAVSKWERGESVPDVLTLVQLADQFGITVNDLLSDPNALPEETGNLEKAMGKVVEKALKRKADKTVILLLCSLLVWGVALLIYVVFSSLELPNSWVAFFYAVPINAIVLLSMLSAWHDFRLNRTLISLIMWGSLLSIYVTFAVFLKVHLWRVFLLGILGQVVIWLWFRLFRGLKREEEDE